MTAKVTELEMAIDALSEEDFRSFRQWFLERDWDKWDEQIQRDSEQGNLDFLVREANEEKRQGKLRDL